MVTYGVFFKGNCPDKNIQSSMDAHRDIIS